MPDDAEAPADELIILVQNSFLPKETKNKIIENIPNMTEEEKEGIKSIISEAEEQRNQVGNTYQKKEQDIIFHFEGELSALISREKIKWNSAREKKSKESEEGEINKLLEEIE